MMGVIGLAWQSLWRHQLRGLLAVLGIAIGITAITGIVSAEASWTKALDAAFQQMGITKVAVDPPRPEAKAMRSHLTLRDVDDIRRGCSLVKAALPISWATLPVKLGREVRPSLVKAAGVGIENALGLELVAGRKLTAEDVANKRAVCLVAAMYADKTYGKGRGLGQIMRIAGRAFTIVGLVNDVSGDHQYRRMMVGPRADAYIPISTAQEMAPLSGVGKIIIEADDQAGAAAQIDSLLRQSLRAKPDATFTVSVASMKAAALRARRRIALFVGLAALLSLLVAGVGLANLLFVSVTERSREIGLRRALGASAWSIGLQFLAEAVVLCLLGAAVGVAATFGLLHAYFAIAFPDTVTAANPMLNYTPEQLATVQLPTAAPAVAWSALLIAALTATAIGLVAGIEPALAAAGIQPAESLRTNPLPRQHARGSLTIFQVALGVATVLLLVSLYEGRVHTELSALRQGQGAGVIELQFADAIPGQPINNSLPAIYSGLHEIVRIAENPARFRSLRRELNLFAYFDPRMQTRTSVHAGARALRLREQDLPIVMGTVPGALEYDAVQARSGGLLPKGAGALVAQGRFFTEEDLDAARRVCVLPASAAQELFGGSSAVGQTVDIGDRPFTVAGVLAPWAEQAKDAFLLDAQSPFPVCVPATTFVREIFDYPDMMDIAQAGWFGAVLRVQDPLQGPAALGQLKRALQPRLRLPRHVVLYPRGPLAEAAEIAARQRWAEVRAGLGGAVTLLIALVGLVNMLLVSVHESVREVGLRRALGALRREIGWQFLREGVGLSAAGAGLGLLLGAPASRWLGHLVAVPMHVPLVWALLSTLGAVAAGALASTGPALKAALIEPIEALRTE